MTCLVWLARRRNRRARQPWPAALGLTGSLPVLAAAIAIATATAASCDLQPVVDQLAANETQVWARLRYPDVEPDEITWAVSDDQGATWRESTEPTELDRRSSVSACDARSVCWRTVPGAGVERSEGDDWDSSFAFSDDQWTSMRDRARRGCQAIGDEFGEVLITDEQRGSVLVTMGHQGVLRNVGEGWERIAVLDAEPISTTGRGWFRSTMPWAVAALVVAIAVLAIGHLRPRWLRLGRRAQHTD